MLRRHALLLSIILFAVGALLTVGNIEDGIVTFINHLFHLHLNIPFRSYGLFYTGSLLITLSIIGTLFFFLIREMIIKSVFYSASAFALVIFYFFFLWKDAVNIPITDDYRMLIFLDQYLQKTTFIEKWNLLIQPVNECRIVLPRLYFLAVLKIFGSVNLKWIIMVNGVMLLFICRMLFRSFSFQQNGIFQLSFLFFMLQFQSYDLAYWATSGVCHYLTFIWMMLCIKSLLDQHKFHFIRSILFALLASITFGNGLLAFPFGCLLLLHKRRMKEAVFFAAVMIALIVFYFYGFHYPRSHFEFDPLAILIYAAAFIGSCFQFMYALYVPVIAGFLFMVVFVYATIKKYYKENLFIWSLSLFIILTAFMTAPFRLHWSPLEPRYGLYSLAAMVLGMMALKEMFSKTRPRSEVSNSKSQISIPTLILMCAISYNLLTGIMFYPEQPVRKQKLQSFVNNWKNGNPLTCSPPVIPDEAGKYLDEAIKSGVWKH